MGEENRGMGGKEKDLICLLLDPVLLDPKSTGGEKENRFPNICLMSDDSLQWILLLSCGCYGFLQHQSLIFVSSWLVLKYLPYKYYIYIIILEVYGPYGPDF